MKIMFLRILSKIAKLMAGGQLVDVVEHSAIKHRLAECEKRIGREGPGKIYFDPNDADELTYWRDIGKWADSPRAREWAFERINALLFRLATVSPSNAQDFYVIQGALAELNNFVKIRERVEDKVYEVNEKLKKLEDDPMATEPPDSLSGQHS